MDHLFWNCFPRSDCDANMWKKVNCYLPYEKTGFPGKQLKPCSGLPYRRSQVYRCPDKTSPDRRRSMCLILTCRVYALHCHAVYGFGRDNKAALGEVSVIMSSCPHRHYCHVLDPNMSSCANLSCMHLHVRLDSEITHPPGAFLNAFAGRPFPGPGCSRV